MEPASFFDESEDDLSVEEMYEDSESADLYNIVAYAAVTLKNNLVLTWL